MATYTPTSTGWVYEMTGSFYLTAGAHVMTFKGLDPDGTDQTDFIDAVHIYNVTSAFARTSYTASYYDASDRDIADVNVGTDGGVPWTPPAYSALERSGTELVTSYVYDAAGNVEFVTDPLALVTAYGYDSLGEMLVSVANWTPTMGPVDPGSLPTETDSANIPTLYTYDGDGNVLTMTAVMPAGETSQVTHYVYGVSTSTISDNDLLAQVQYPDPVSGTNTSSGTYNQAETYAYDALGEETGYTDRNGTTHTYAYDILGRLSSDSVTFGSGDLANEAITKLGYSYDNAGNLSLATSYNSSGTAVNQVQMIYDGFGQLLSDAQAHGGTVADDGSTPAVTYTYDLVNGERLSSLTTPAGETINYNYFSGLDSITSRVSSLSDFGGLIQSYTYLGLDTPVTFTDGNGITLSYLGTIGSSSGDAGDQYSGLDRFGRVVDQKWQNSSGTVVDEQQYGYDADSNMLYQDNMVSAMSGRSELFTYDGLNRLTNLSIGTMTVSGGTASISSPTRQQGWNLNALGGWNSSSTTVSGTTNTISRSNSAQNQINSINGTDLDYDKNGNTLTDNNGHTYTYDAWNRLVSVTVGTDTITYGNDALGRRITETDSAAGTSTDLYYSDRGQVVEQDTTTSDSVTTDIYTWSAFYVNQLVARNESIAITGFDDDDGFGSSSFGTRVYAEQDANYNVTSLTGSTGTVLERYSYDPYGLQTVYNASGTALSGSANNWIVGFQGGFENPVTGLVHFMTRDENTGTGTWIEQDPTGVDGSGANLYQGFDSNPVNSVDPSGEQSVNFPVPIAPAVGSFPLVGNPNPYTGPGSLVPPSPVPLAPPMPTPTTLPPVSIGVPNPGFWESLIPLWGSGNSAIHDFQTGQWGWGLFNTALAVSDVCLLRSLATAGIKVGVKGITGVTMRVTAKGTGPLSKHLFVHVFFDLEGELYHATSDITKFLNGFWGKPTSKFYENYLPQAIGNVRLWVLDVEKFMAPAKARSCWTGAWSAFD